MIYMHFGGTTYLKMQVSNFINWLLSDKSDKSRTISSITNSKLMRDMQFFLRSDFIPHTCVDYIYIGLVHIASSPHLPH